MACVIEVMGLSLPYSASTPANDSAKLQECLSVARFMHRLLVLDMKPRAFTTKKCSCDYSGRFNWLIACLAFHNAMVVNSILGGSTNVVLHLLAIAKAADVDLTIDDFQRVSDMTPFLANMKPSGKCERRW